MGKIIAAHSFRGGTGKSSIVANTAACLACKGKRVCIIDTDIQSPGVHVFFGLQPEDIKHSLNEYLWGKCNIEDAAMAITKDEVKDAGGAIYLIPSSMGTTDITRILKEGYEVSQLLTMVSLMPSERLTWIISFWIPHPGIGE
jgi:septum site-determining protein MinD